MKVVMINDCAHVGETLIEYLPKHVEAIHIKRTRGLWSKTFGIAYKILRARGDMYHANYLLQDCYIASKLGKRPLLGHAHGSDLRSSIKHFALGRIVKHNLKNSDKVLVSTPDVLDVAKQCNEEAEYFPNPVNLELFYPKPIELCPEKLRVLIASDSNWKVKGTDIAIRALSELSDRVEVYIINYGKDFLKTVTLAKSLGLHLNILPKTSHENIREYYWKADLVIDRFKLGSLGMVSLEAIACGRPAITYVSSEYDAYKNFPLKDVNTVEGIVGVIRNTPSNLWKTEHDYLIKYHAPTMLIRRLLSTYEGLLSTTGR